MWTVRVCSLEPQDVYGALRSFPVGLSADEVALRRAEAGPNSLPPAKPRSVLKELAAQFANMFAVVLMVASGLTFLIYVLSPPRVVANLELAIGILGVVLLNAMIGFVQEHAAERTAQALQAMVPAAASVMILLDDSFASIVAAVELGRAVFQNIRKFLIYLFSHNLAELAPILAAVFVGFPLVPLSALQVLSIDLGSDVLPALALGAEQPEPGIMSRPPRPPAEQLFNWAVVRRFCFLGTIQSCGVVFASFWKIHSAHIPFDAFTSANPTYRQAVTMTQAGIVVSQFFNSFAVRSDEQSIFKIGPVLQPPADRGRMHQPRIHRRRIVRSRSAVGLPHCAAAAGRLALALRLGSAASGV